MLALYALGLAVLAAAAYTLGHRDGYRRGADRSRKATIRAIMRFLETTNAGEPVEAATARANAEMRDL